MPRRCFSRPMSPPRPFRPSGWHLCHRRLSSSSSFPLPRHPRRSPLIRPRPPPSDRCPVPSTHHRSRSDSPCRDRLGHPFPTPFGPLAPPLQPLYACTLPPPHPASSTLRAKALPLSAVLTLARPSIPRPGNHAARVVPPCLSPVPLVRRAICTTERLRAAYGGAESAPASSEPC